MNNRPIETFSAGNTEVAIWENQGEERKFFTVTAKRTYMDGNGQWKDAGTVNLLPQQIPDMILALQKSHEFLRMGLNRRVKQVDTSPALFESKKVSEQSLDGDKPEQFPSTAESMKEKPASFAEKATLSRGSRRSR